MSKESLIELAIGIESAGNRVTLKVIDSFRSRISAVQVTETPDEEVEALLDELISELQKALEVEEPEHLNQLEQLEKDHKDSVLTMDMFGLAPKARIPQPTFEQIKPNLTPEMLERVKYLHEPKLICVPTRTKSNSPIRFQELAKAMDQAKADGKTSQVHTGEPTKVFDVIEGNLSYRKGNQWMSQTEYFAQSDDWEVWIVEGAEEMPDPRVDQRYAIDFPKGPSTTIQEKHDYIKTKFDSLNLEGLTYETWIVLLMDALRKDRKIDNSNYSDLLNNYICNDTGFLHHIAAASWKDERPKLSFMSQSGRFSTDCRFRAAIRVM